MSETKYRYRVPPCPACDIPAMESWLEDMAARGLHLSYDGFFMGTATFEEGPPRQEIFRLEATATKKGLFSREYEPDPEVIDLHRQMGWTYRGRREQFHIYSADDPNAPELNTDPQVQALSIAALSNYLRSALFQALFLTAFYALFYFGDILLTASIVLGSWRVGLLTVLLLWDLMRKVRELVVLGRYKKQLGSGEPLPHRGDYKPKGYLAAKFLRKVLWTGVICSMLVTIVNYATDEDVIPLESWSYPLPFATLSDIYPDAEVETQQGLLKSQLTHWTDPLAPSNYDYTEYAEVTLNGETLDCYLTVSYHETCSEWTARLLAREFVSQSGDNPLDHVMAKLLDDEVITVQPIPHPDADYAVFYWKNRDEPILILRKDTIVLRLNLDVLGGRHEFTPTELASIFLDHLS